MTDQTETEKARRIIYVVTSGSYSDYGIVAVFDRKDLADALVAGNTDGYDGYQVEEYPLNPGEAEYHAGRSLWSVEMRHDGSVRSTHDNGFAHASVELPSLRCDFGTYPDYGFKGYYIRLETWARDQEQAIKSANEVRAQWIADGRWDREEAELKAKR